MNDLSDAAMRLLSADNRACLERCRGHRFVPTDQCEETALYFRCQVCGGTVNRSEVHWYRSGVAHAKAAFAKSDTEVICALEKP